MIIVKNVLTGEEITRYTELSGKWSCVVNDIKGNGYKLNSVYLVISSPVKTFFTIIIISLPPNYQ